MIIILSLPWIYFYPMWKKVLIIEDNQLIRENTAELLELNNYVVFTAENGHIGYKLAKTKKPDIILCDIMMPETDGRKFLKLAKEDINIKKIPIIFFSAGSLPEEIIAGLKKEADGYLIKPFSESQLLRAIESGLNKGIKPI